jgi:uncharacterized protein (DUF1015 family)
MTTAKPFAGIRYKANELSKLVCPPYDIISPDEKRALEKKSKHNMVRLELSAPVGAKSNYNDVGRLFRKWQSDGVLVHDPEPSFYFYEQIFDNKGKNNIRRGFFAAIKLEEPGKGSVKPHEKTLSRPKEDRLLLMRAVNANLSPIFGLYHDPGGKILGLARKIASKKPDQAAKDPDGVGHKLWKLDSGPKLKAITAELRSREIFIADGHHRYETAWNYSREIKKKNSNWKPESECNYIMIYLCAMEDPGLVIWPTHRVVVPPLDIEERISRYFNVLPGTAFKKLENRAPQPLLVWNKGEYRTLILRDYKTLARMMPDKCKAYRELGVSMLHAILLYDIPADKITYVKDEKETVRTAAKRKCMAVIVPATPISAVKEIALAGQTMPQKSTYFYPKVITGMVVHGLE